MQASGVAVRVHVEKAVRAEEEQDWQVRMESGHKSGRLERTSGWKGSSILQDPRKLCRTLRRAAENLFGGHL